MNFAVFCHDAERKTPRIRIHFAQELLPTLLLRTPYLSANSNPRRPPLRFQTRQNFVRDDVFVISSATEEFPFPISEPATSETGLLSKTLLSRPPTRISAVCARSILNRPSSCSNPRCDAKRPGSPAPSHRRFLYPNLSWPFTTTPWRDIRRAALRTSTTGST